MNAAFELRMLFGFCELGTRGLACPTSLAVRQRPSFQCSSLIGAGGRWSDGARAEGGLTLHCVKDPQEQHPSCIAMPLPPDDGKARNRKCEIKATFRP